MKKTFTFAFLFAMSCSIGLAQNKYTDSLTHLLVRAKQDTDRVMIMAELSFYHRFTNMDSSIFYGQKARSLAKQINYPRGEARALTRLALALREKGDLPKSLELSLTAKKIAESNNYIAVAASCYTDIGLIYLDLKEYAKSLHYIKDGMKTFIQAGDERGQAWGYFNMGNVYEQMNQLDSAQKYMQKAHENIYSFPEIVPDFYLVLGNIQKNKGNNKSALAYYRKGIREGLKFNDIRDISSLYGSMATLYKQLNQPDSSIFCAMNGLKYGQKSFYKKGVFLSSNLLSELYDPINPQEALRYNKIAAAAKDSLFGAGNILTIQRLINQESERQQELEAAKTAYQNQLKQYGLLAGLGVFLIIASILYRNNRQKQKVNNVLLKQKGEIEAQAREAQVEVALERVRTKTMAMHNSQDVADTVGTLFDELVKLGIETLRCGIVINDSPMHMEVWTATSNPNGEVALIIGCLDMTIHPLLQGIYNAWETKQSVFTYEMVGQDLIDYYNAINNLPDYPVRFDIAALPSKQVHNDFYFPEGALFAFTAEPIPAEAAQIFKRFAGVFGLTYRRFLDLQKAEAQAREAQIEVALERVRSRAMAMQNSDELAGLDAALFNELTKLDFALRHCVIYIIDEGSWSCRVVWAANTQIDRGSESYYVKLIDHPFPNALMKAWKERKTKWVYDLNGIEKRSYDDYLFNETECSKLPDIVKAAIREPERIILSFSFNNFGGLQTAGLESLSDGNLDILSRFGKVFDMTYTRFNDLKQAEEQAREAKIETALERVRSRTMAMQKSEELHEVVQMVYEQLHHLNFNVDSAYFAVNYKESDDLDIWVAVPSQLYPTKIHMPYIDHPLFNSIKEAKEDGLDFFAESYAFEDKNKFFDHFFKNAPEVPEERKEFVYGSAGFEQSTVLMKNVALSIQNYAPIPYSAAENATLMRFGNVFEQTYTRFNDLKQAEEQTREAKIEAALERVRGKAMAMHNSADLSATASMVFTELGKLGVNPIRCGVGLFNKDSRKVLLYSATTSKDSDTLSLIGWAALSWHHVLERIYDTWLKQENYFPVLNGEQLKSYYEILLSGLAVPSVPDWEGGEEQYGHFLQFPEGCLYAWAEKPYTDNEIKILDRFKGIISLTFRRYLELQKSEENAREAVRQSSLDRVRAEIASMRSTTDLERITPLIWNELTIVGVPFIRCGVFIMDEPHQLIHIYLSTPEGKAIAAFHSPYSTPGNMAEILRHWQDKKIYLAHWDDVAFAELANILVSQGVIATPQQYLSITPRYGVNLHCFPFLQGMLYVGNIAPLADDEKDLVQSLADAFSTAYARYEDFNKLEIAKQQVDKALVELTTAQTQLIQSEKMASLGELTAGIAHEIQNPLNFVNNFSEVNAELIDEMTQEIAKGNLDEVIALADDIKENEQKIILHGKRADAIVKGMLEHSRSRSGKIEPTDINVMADEYMRLSYHGLRSKDKSFNAELITHFDTDLPKINVVQQDMGRILLNLFNNAFYAVYQKCKASAAKHSFGGVDYTPEVTVTIYAENGQVIIKVKDNGVGIPDTIKEKIMQPFFTTKPTGEGTGLGLSLTYDMVVKGHGGKIEFDTKKDEFTEFIVALPLN